MSSRTFLQLIVLSVFFVSPARAADVPQSFTLDGKLYSDALGTTALEDSSIGFTVQILDDAKTCVLYEETQSVSTAASKGYFSMQVGSDVGSPLRTAGDSANSMSQVFQNISTISGKLLSNGSACNVPAVGGKRRYVRVKISPASMGGAPRTLSPDLTIDSVPNAVVAERAETLQGLRATNVLQVNTSGANQLSQSNLESLFTSSTRFNSLTSIVDGTSTSYMRTNSASGAQLPVMAGAPTGPTPGSIWYDSSDSKLKYQTSVGPIIVGSGSGTVTSVGFTAPSELSVAGAPITASGTIAVTWATQTANKVFAAPDATTGTPTFRVLVAGDIPNIPWTKITSLLPTTLLGYGITDAVKNNGGTPSIESGLNAAKGAAATAGRVWISTDTKEIYRDTGAVWELIGSGSSGLGYTPVNKAGDTMTGLLVLSADPSANLGAATKQYVDSSTSTAAANYLRKDGTVALTADWDVDGAGAGTTKITGLADPTASDGAVTKNYADTKFITKTLPAAPAAGQNGQSLRWNNGTTTWEYFTAGSGGGDFMKDGSVAMTGDLKMGSNQVRFGSNSYLWSDGSGVFNLAYTSGSTDGFLRLKQVTLQQIDAVYSAGLNSAGQNVSITSGVSTGNAAGGALIFKTSPAGSSGSTSNTIVEAMRIAGSGNVGIGTTSPAAPLNVVQSGVGSQALILVDTYDPTNAQGSALIFRGARGSAASPSAVQSGDWLGAIGGRGYGATGFSPNSKSTVVFLADENWTDTAQGASIALMTTANGDTTRTERMRVSAAGNVGIGTATPGSLLHVEGAAGSLGQVYVNGANSDSYVTLNVTNGGHEAGILFQSAGMLLWEIYKPGSSQDLRFWTTLGGDVMTLAGSTVGIGTTSPAAKLDVTDTGTTSSAIIVPRAGNFTGTAANGMIRYNTTSTLFEFRQNGAWVNYTTVSDGRLKKDVEPVVNGLDIVNKLNPVFYNWDLSNPKASSFSDKHEVGFIAQEVEKVLPEVVNQGEDSYRSLEYGKMVSVVVAAVKELDAKAIGMDREIASVKTDVAAKDKEIESLKQENAAQAKRLDAMKSYLCAKDPQASICK